MPGLFYCPYSHPEQYSGIIGFAVIPSGLLWFQVDAILSPLITVTDLDQLPFVQNCGDGALYGGFMTRKDNIELLTWWNAAFQSYVQHGLYDILCKEMEDSGSKYKPVLTEHHYISISYVAHEHASDAIDNIPHALGLGGRLISDHHRPESLIDHPILPLPLLVYMQPCLMSRHVPKQPHLTWFHKAPDDSIASRSVNGMAFSLGWLLMTYHRRTPLGFSPSDQADLIRCNMKIAKAKHLSILTFKVLMDRDL